MSSCFCPHYDVAQIQWDKKDSGNSENDKTNQPNLTEETKYISVYLKDCNLKKLFSKDLLNCDSGLSCCCACCCDGCTHTGLREGTLVIKVADYITTLGWSTDKNGHIKGPKVFKDHLIYYGPINAMEPISLEIVVTENDDEDRRVLKKISSVLTFVETITAAAPPPYNLSSLVAGVLAATSKFAINFVDDDEEWRYHGSLPFEEKIHLINRLEQKNPDREPLSVTLEVTKQEPPKSKKKLSLNITLAEMKLPSMKAPCKHRTLFQFSSTFGTNEKSQTKTFETRINNGTANLNQILNVKEWPLFKGVVLEDSPIPFAINMTCIAPPKTKEAEDATNLATKIESLINGTITEVHRQERNEISKKLEKHQRNLAKVTDPILQADIQEKIDKITQKLTDFNAEIAEPDPKGMIGKSVLGLKSLYYEFVPSNRTILSVSRLLVLKEVEKVNNNKTRPFIYRIPFNKDGTLTSDGSLDSSPFYIELHIYWKEITDEEPTILDLLKKIENDLYRSSNSTPSELSTKTQSTESISLKLNDGQK